MRRRGGVRLYGERKRFRFRAADAAAERDGSSCLTAATRSPKDIPDGDDPWGIVGHVLESLPPGSYLTVSDTVRDINTGRVTEGTARLNQRMGSTQLTLRTRPDFERFFDGLEMVEPGVVPLPEWHGPGSPYPIPCYAGMGRKP